MLDRIGGTLHRAVINQEITVLLGLIAVGAIFSLAAENFLTPFNLFQMTRQMALFTVIAIGMTFVISASEIDISVGAIYNLAANVMALLIAHSGFDPWIAGLIALFVGVLAGLLNGALAVALGLPTLIVTLGTVNLYRGITILLSRGLSIGNLPNSSFYNIGSGQLGPIPYLAIFALLVVIAAAWVYRNTVFAKQLLAVGSNREAAKRSGVRVKARKVQVMGFMGLMCGIAAVMGMAYLRSASPQSGVGYELIAIAATVVGGTPLQGGLGTIWGTLIGIALIIVIQNGLLLLGLPVAWQITSTGVMILVAVAIQQLIRLKVQHSQA